MNKHVFFYLCMVFGAYSCAIEEQIPYQSSASSNKQPVRISPLAKSDSIYQLANYIKIQ